MGPLKQKQGGERRWPEFLSWAWCALCLWILHPIFGCGYQKPYFPGEETKGPERLSKLQGRIQPMRNYLNWDLGLSSFSYQIFLLPGSSLPTTPSCCSPCLPLPPAVWIFRCCSPSGPRREKVPTEETARLTVNMLHLKVRLEPRGCGRGTTADLDREKLDQEKPHQWPTQALQQGLRSAAFPPESVSSKITSSSEMETWPISENACHPILAAS